MIKQYNNIKIKKKGSQSATYPQAEEKLIPLLRTDWLFLEIKNLYKNLIYIIKVLRFISSPFLSFLVFKQQKYEKVSNWN
jgi:hypothetical protein